MMRTRNGHVDNGSPIRGSSKTCPSCGSNKYVETLSLEECKACGMRCDYWGDGANEEYNAYTRARWAEQDEAIQREVDRMYGMDDDEFLRDDDD